MPLVCRWTGEAFAPLARSARECDAERVVGEIYRLVDHAERSEASHRHYFAAVAEAWATLPETETRFHTSEHLRKFALIKKGYATQRQLVASSRAEAVRLAAFIAPMDTFAIVEVKGAVVTVWEAESQSYRAMGKERFEESKRAVLDFCAELIGVSLERLESQAGKAA